MSTEQKLLEHILLSLHTFSWDHTCFSAYQDFGNQLKTTIKIKKHNGQKHGDVNFSPASPRVTSQPINEEDVSTRLLSYSRRFTSNIMKFLVSMSDSYLKTM